MLPNRVSNRGPLTYESGALPIALRGPAGTPKISIETILKLLNSLDFLCGRMCKRTRWNDKQ